MGIFGLWAYDTVWARAMAAKKVGDKEPVILFGLGISQTGPEQCWRQDL